MDTLDVLLNYAFYHMEDEYNYDYGYGYDYGYDYGYGYDALLLDEA